MSGFFGCVSKRDCVADVFYGTDYHSHLGTKRGGMAFYDGKDFVRTIHSLENAYFRNKFEDDLPRFEGSRQGIGIISDMESQPITLTSHLGRFSLVAIGRIDNLEELTRELLGRRLNFAELSASRINPTELVATLVSLGDSFREGIELVQSKVKGSCSMLILTPEGIYASRDKYGRTPVVVGRGGDGYAIATESSAFANLDYRVETELKPAQTLFITADGIREITPGGKRKQICSFMWVYYGYPSSYYEGVNVEDARYRCGCALACRDEDVRDVDLVAGVPDSGVGHALGYSNGRRLPYKRAFVKYTPTGPRSVMPHNQEMLVYIVFIAVMLVLVLNKWTGSLMYVAPAVGVLVLIYAKVLNVQEAVQKMTSDMIWMIAGVLAVADALGSSGAGELIGSTILGLLGSNPHPLFVAFLFSAVTVIMTTFISNTATMNVLTPVAASVALAGGWDPRGLVLIIAVGNTLALGFPSGAAECAVCYAAGNYNPAKVLKFTLPYIILGISSMALTAYFMYPVY